MDSGDEKKTDLAEQEEETLPEPDEHLMVDQGNGRVWLVKMPKFLRERWSAIDVEGVHLATVRLYPDVAGPSGKKPRILLFLPPNSSNGEAAIHSTDPLRPTFTTTTSYPSSGDVDDPDTYDLEIVQEKVDNQIVVAEREAAFSTTGPVNSRARATVLTGRVKHECNLRPVMSASYRRQMKERHRKYNIPQRQIMRIEEAGVSGGRGGINRLSSGVGVGAGKAFGDLIKTKPKPAKGTFERMARIPRNQLLDLLFTHFRDAPRWPIKVLRERTQQPEAYLKEVLNEIATLHRSGEFNGMWELKENFKDGDFTSVNYSRLSIQDDASDIQMGDEAADDEDEDEDEDMEEVS